MTAKEIIDAVNAKEVNVPVGTKAFFVIHVDGDGKLNAAGDMGTELIDEVAFWLMSQKRMPKEEAKKE